MNVPVFNAISGHSSILYSYVLKNLQKVYEKQQI